MEETVIEELNRRIERLRELAKLAIELEISLEELMAIIKA